jgi:GAF domain-containing protein
VVELQKRNDWRQDGSRRRDSLSDVDTEWADVLARGGVVAVLRRLNERTRFRFTGVYRVEPPFLHNLYLFDRENPTVNVLGDVSRLDETYCAIVYDDGGPFETSDAPADERLRSHAARERVQSYCGVPIRHPSGLVCGTLCHYDVRPRLISRAELELLEQVASLLAPQFAR